MRPGGGAPHDTDLYDHSRYDGEYDPGPYDIPTGAFDADPYAADPYAADPYAADPYDADPYDADLYDADPYDVPGFDTGPGMYGGLGGRPWAPRTPRELLEEVRRGMPIELMLPEARQISEARLYADTGPVLVEWVRQLYGAGWQPTELIRLARLRAKAPGAELLRRAVAVERAARADPTATDPRWEQQWAAADLPVEPQSAGWVTEWAAGGAGTSPPEEILRLAAALGRAPRLEQLLPPPAGVASSGPVPGRPTGAAADPILERVRALLAKAESTEHEPEALAFTAKAQELMTKHAIDLAMLDHAVAGAETPHIVRLPIDPPYADLKALLVQIVAEHTRCRTAYHSKVAMTSVIGYPTDLEAVELLFTSLLVQAQRALAEASADAPPGARARSQAFRSAFLHGFAARIGDRLAEANRLAYADAAAETFLPVLRARDARVEDFVADRFGAMSSEQVRGGFDPLGYARGELAGDAAALASGAVEKDRR